MGAWGSDITMGRWGRLGVVVDVTECSSASGHGTALSAFLRPGWEEPILFGAVPAGGGGGEGRMGGTLLIVISPPAPSVVFLDLNL